MNDSKPPTGSMPPPRPAINLAERHVLHKQEVADVLQISVRKVEYMIEEGQLPSVRLGHSTVRIPAEAVRKILSGE